MQHGKIRIEKLTPTLGAEIHGLDLANPSRDEIATINRALLDNGVVFFRDQELTPDQHIAFGRHFGRLHVHPYLPNEPDHPEIMKLKAEKTTESQEKHYNSLWHSDVTCDHEPPMGAILMLREIPENGGGDTIWCNTYAAYDALSASMRRFLAGLTAIHGGAIFFQKEETGGKAGQTSEVSEHPVVRTHPVTGRQALYVNSVFTKSIVQLTTFESDSLLQMLFRHIENPLFHCRFKWRSGSVAFWDNRCTQHRAIGDYAGFTRYGQRVTLCGDKPFHRSEAAVDHAAD